MNVVYERCCGLDIHKKSIVACLIVSDAKGQRHKEIRTFGAMTADIEQLAGWLASHGVTHVAMESTGVYWQPIYNLLEGRFTLLLVNAQHIKAVPGRKTDVRDCEWLADLLQHGLLKGSFVPSREQRELRELTRYRTSLLQERAAEVNRLQKTLESANIKLSSVATDITGVSGRAILAALISGNTDSAAMADLAKGRLRTKLAELERALQGRFGEHQRWLIAQQLAHIDSLDEQIDALDAKVRERMRPFERMIGWLDSVPGINRRVAEVIIAELGVDMSRFATAKHLASWAGLCPGHHESAGKRKSGKTRKGNRWLRAALTQAAHAASRTKRSYLGAHYRRLAARRGRKKAIVAVAHTMLVIVYELLTHETTYQELGPNYFDELHRQAVERRLIRRLENLGYKVTLEAAQQAA